MGFTQRGSSQPKPPLTSGTLARVARRRRGSTWGTGSRTWPVAGLARAATAGYAGRRISTGGAAAMLTAEFDIIGTDRAVLDPG